MNVAHFEPIRIRRIDPSGNEDAGIGTEKIDLAVRPTSMRMPKPPMSAATFSAPSPSRSAATTARAPSL
jgi:hypothetical protein